MTGARRPRRFLLGFPVGLLVQLAAGVPFVVAALAGVPGTALAGEADVLAVDVRCRPAPGGRPASVCQFSVTVQHADEGWDHYANGYEVVAPDGTVLVTRILRHPHVEEQPFRRSVPRVRIQDTVTEVQVRATDSIHGGGGKTVTVKVPHAGPEEEAAPEKPGPSKGGGEAKDTAP